MTPHSKSECSRGAVARNHPALEPEMIWNNNPCDAARHIIHQSTGKMHRADMSQDLADSCQSHRKTVPDLLRNLVVD